MYLHCPLHCAHRVQLLQAVDAWRVVQAPDALTGDRRASAHKEGPSEERLEEREEARKPLL
jgi:hypothetical protein